MVLRDIYIEQKHLKFANVKFDISSVPKEYDFCKGGNFINPFSDRQGGNQVSAILDLFIKAAQTVKAAQSIEPEKAKQAPQPGELERAAQTCKSAREELQNRLNYFK